MMELRRSISFFRATTMVVGIIIGASIFVQPSAVTAQVPSVVGVLVVWLAAGLLTLIGALVIAELASAWPHTGGVYVFLREIYSPPVAFLWGWAMFWTMHSGIVAVIAMVFARYVGTFVPLGDGGTRVVAIAAVLILSAVNYRGVRQGSAVQAVFTSVKVLAIILIIGVAFTVATHANGALSDATAPAATMPGGRAFVLALIAKGCLPTFGGWHMVSYAAEETIDPTRTIPRALVAGTLTVTALYVALNAAYLRVLPLATVAKSTRVAADFADAAVGGHGAQIMSALVILSTIGGMNGVILAGPRVYLAMAQDGVLFKWVGAVHAEYRTPHRAIALQAVWSSVLVATGSYAALFTRVVYTEWIFFGMLAGGLFLVRRRPGYNPPYRVWGYPILPAVFVVSTAAIVINQIIAQPVDSISGLAFVLLGLPVYYIWARNPPPKPRSRSA